MGNNTANTIKGLEEKFNASHLHRPMQVERYDAGDHVTYEINLITPDATHKNVKVSLFIERFVGGGFAGQVYKTHILKVDGTESPLQVGQTYALKIFIPPSHHALFFRNLLYAIGFQGPFQIQCNPVAARAGALWQKFIRRAASLRFQDTDAVNDVHGTFIDYDLGSCGEISNWVEGRTWRLEVNDHADLLNRWENGKLAEGTSIGSLEYRTKKTFMHEFSALLHEMGAHEFARQYEWSTWKSQPNVLKRLNTDLEPARGLTAVDFRAGLTLLPFLPMSPGDIKLILQGIKRGSLVQFDRGDVNQLESFIKKNSADFSDLLPLLEELKTCELVYRNSIPDITHHLLNLIRDKALRATIVNSTITGWSIKKIVDTDTEKRLHANKSFFLFFVLLGFIPFLGKILRLAFGRQDYRDHYKNMLFSFTYFQRAMFANRMEALIRWYRGERITETLAERISSSLLLYLYHIPLSILPKKIHRLLSDRGFFMDTLYNTIIRPVRLYFNPVLREEWLREIVSESRDRQVLSKEDAEEILGQIHDPYIHKYLQSLAVHIAMAPITHVISTGLAILYLLNHPEIPRAEAYATAAGILAFFQVIPVSPGSFARGLYVLFLAIKERNLKDYNLALPLSFFKYVGYISFPIQMTYSYPTLARCMAGFWATRMARVIPVFGEGGALLEYKTFNIFYNWPLTIRRKMNERAEWRKTQKTRSWHIIPIVALISAASWLLQKLHISTTGMLPPFALVAPSLILFGLLGGILVNTGSGGSSFSRRVLMAVGSGVGIGFLAALGLLILSPEVETGLIAWISTIIWYSFITATFSTTSAVITEFKV